MRRLERFLDPRHTKEGKILSLFLALVLAFSMIGVPYFGSTALAKEGKAQKQEQKGTDTGFNISDYKAFLQIYGKTYGSSELASPHVDYNSKDQRPTIIVKDKEGNELPESEYTVNYGSEKYVDADKYGITVSVNDKFLASFEFNIDPLPITVTTQKASKEYDGKELTAGADVEGVLAEDMAAVIEAVNKTVTGKQTEPGESDNTCTLKEGDIVETNYVVKEVTLGKLTVNKAEVKVYGFTVNHLDMNGNPLFDGKLKEEGTLPYGKTLEAQAKDLTDDGYELISEKATDSIQITDDPDKNVINFSYAPIEYKIGYKLDGGSLPEGSSNPETYTVESDDITLVNPVRAGYTFAGWEGTNLEGATKDVTIAKGSTGDREFIATWTRNNYGFTVNHLDMNGNPLFDGKLKEEGTLPYGKTLEAQAKDLTDDGYELISEKATDSIQITDDPDKNVINFSYAPIEYKIGYKLDGGSLPEGSSNPETYTVESDDITLVNPVRAGYTFLGWTGTDLSGATERVTIANGSKGDREYVATWVPAGDTPYKVEHYLQSADGSYELRETIESTGATEAPVTAAINSYEGYTHNPDAEGTVLEGNIAGDGNTTLKVFYDINTYTVSYDLNGAAADEGIQTEYGDIKHGADTPTVPDPTRDGYVFNGWSPVVADTVTEDATYVAQWTPVTPAPEPADPITPANPDNPIDPVTPNVPNVDDNPATTATPATSAVTPVAAATPAATPAAADATPAATEGIADNENPLAGGDEVIADEENPLGAFDQPHCWVHWLMIIGLVLNLVYGAAVLLRRKKNIHDMDDFEDQVLGHKEGARAHSHAAKAGYQAI